MTRTRWPFGVVQQQQPQESEKPAAPITYSADAKMFGLENFGNTCYANSVIQALYFCSPFRDLVIQEADHSNPQEYVAQPLRQSSQRLAARPPLTPNRRKPERQPSLSRNVDHLESDTNIPTYIIPTSPPTLFSALRSLFAYVSFNPSEKGTIAPRAFIEKLKDVNELFRSSMHQDAHEFLNYLLNKIIEEIEEERKRAQRSGDPCEPFTAPHPVPANPAPARSTLTTSSPLPTVVTAHNTGSNAGTHPQDATLVHKLFEGTLTSETRCLTCEIVSSRDESFLDLSIDIDKNSSVTACLRQFSASEMLSQRNKFFCDSCCGLQEAEKRMKIKKLPNILALHLKRFKYQEDLQKYIKLTYRVAFPFELRLFNTVDDAEDADRLYNLFAIVVHIGSGPHHGHYISIIKTHGQWFVFDDDNVFSIPEQDISKYFGDPNAAAAYVLYYQAANIDLESLGLNLRPPEEPKDEQLNCTSDSSSPPSPLQEPLPVPSFPPGLSPGVALDDSQEPEARSTPQPDDSNATDSNHISPSASESNGINPPKSAVSSIFQGFRRPPTLSRPKSSNLDTKKKFNALDQTMLSAHHDGNTSNGLGRPSTSYFPSVGEKEKEKYSDFKPGNWFRRRSLKALDKKARQSTVEVPALPPPPTLQKAEERPQSTTPNGSTVEPDYQNSHGEQTGALPSHPSTALVNHVSDTQNTHNHHSQHRRRHKTARHGNSSPGDSISSTGSISFLHPPLPAPFITPAQSSSSSALLPTPSHSRSPSQPFSSTPASEISNSLQTLEHRNSMNESSSDRNKGSRPLPPVPPLSTVPFHSAAAAPYLTLPTENGDANESVPESPSRSATTVSSTSHARTPSHNPVPSNFRRKLSFTAPLLGLGRKDKDKHQGKVKAPFPYSTMLP